MSYDQFAAFSYYFLRDKNKIAGHLLMMFPPPARVTVTTLWEEIDGVLMAFIRGNLLVSLFVTLLTTTGLFFLGVEYAAVLGILYGILDIIPYFGPFLGAIPVILLPLMQGDVNMILLILLLFGVQQCENFFISPRILGDQVGLHPVTVMVLVLIGGYCGGILGMVGVIPLAAVLKVLLIFLYERLVATSVD
ncbi:MAG: AI-2E family transporter [Clostridia bacterium]